MPVVVVVDAVYGGYTVLVVGAVAAGGAEVPISLSRARLRALNIHHRARVNEIRRLNREYNGSLFGSRSSW